MESDAHKPPCTSLKNFRNLIIGVMSIQSMFVIVALGMTVNSQSRMAAHSEQLMQLRTRQESIEKKTDAAASDAAKALATSGKTESDIAWIRDGLAELKIAVRYDRLRQPTIKNTP